jgi:hypothetical protein
LADIIHRKDEVGKENIRLLRLQISVILEALKGVSVKGNPVNPV